MALRIAGVAGTALVAVLAATCAWIAFAHGGAEFGSASAVLPMLRLDAGVVPLAGAFCALLALLAAAVAVWSTRRGRPADAALIAAFSAAMLLVLCSRSVALFFLAWEAMAVTSVFLVAAHHERRTVRRAAFTYLVVSQTGALCVLVALVLLARFAGDPSFATIARAAPALPAGTRDAVFVLALLGFGSKAGLMPLHFWLPQAHPVAPPQASALLSGAMLKIALYGLALVVFGLAAPAPSWWGTVLMLAGTVSSIGGVLYALVDHDLKRLLAFSSVENVGIITIALGVAVVARSSELPAVAAIALAAALYHCVNHGLFKALLFLGAGSVADRAGTVDLERLGGLWRPLAWTAPLFLIGCAAIVGLPPLNGFVSEWLTFQALAGGLVAHDPVARAGVVAAIGGLALTGGLACACFAKVFGVAFLGRPRRLAAAQLERESFDAGVGGMVVLAAACVVLGVVPLPAFEALTAVTSATFGAAPLALPALPLLPLALVALPFAFGAAACVMVVRGGTRFVPTWTCGSPVTPRSQYSATAFSKPLRTIFAFVLAPQRQRTIEAGESRWFPRRIVYRTESRYLVDETWRNVAAATMRVSRRTRRLQSGSLRLYLAYAVLAVIVIVVAAR